MAIFQQTLEKLQHFTLLATTTITATGNQTGVDLLEYDGDVQIILAGTAAGAGGRQISRGVPHRRRPA